jgi:hypothetical protein
MFQTTAEQREATNDKDRGKVLEKFWKKVGTKVKISKNAKECKRRCRQAAYPWLRFEAATVQVHRLKRNQQKEIANIEFKGITQELFNRTGKQKKISIKLDQISAKSVTPNPSVQILLFCNTLPLIPPIRVFLQLLLKPQAQALQNPRRLIPALKQRRLVIEPRPICRRNVVLFRGVMI